MNYDKIYWNIITFAQEREYPDKEYEYHHIIPRSEGGSNKKTNKVRLTPKEHHLCHLCLIKCKSCLKYCFRHLSLRQYIAIKDSERKKIKIDYGRRKF